MMHNATRKEIRLPSPPAIALRILEAVKQDEASFEELARIIQVDPALTAKILRVANSSFYSRSNTVNTIEKALSVLGLTVTKNVALSFVIAREITGPDCGAFNFNSFWRRAVTCAVGAKLLASLLNYKNEDLFVSALLQDIGILVMYLRFPADYQQVLEEKRVAESSVLGFEQKIFGFDHQEVGAELLEDWGLPESISTVIRHHHGSDCADEVRLQARFLRWSALLASIYDGTRSVEKVRRLKAEICPDFPVTAESLDNLVDDVAGKSVEVLSFFEIDPGEMQPFSQLLQEANEELRRINLSYGQVVMQAKQARKRAEKLAAELQKANARLRNLAFRDGLTGLYNYRYFQELMERETGRARRHHQPLSLMLFDIDYFKKVNDTHGHPAGDEVLRHLAKRVQTIMRTSDLVARYGGEEFAVILPMTDLAGGKVFAERLRRQMEEMRVVVDSVVLRITVSIGVATWEPGMESVAPSRIIAVADAAMYQAKNQGRNFLVVRKMDE